MLKPREEAPKLKIDIINGGDWQLGDQNPREFTMIVFYRGLHCPVCKKTLEALKDYLPEFNKRGVKVIAISSDNKERASRSVREWDIGDLKIGYGYPVEKAEAWGLFVSEGIEDEPNYFIEPGIFLIRQNGTLYSAHTQSMPFARPRFDDFLKGIDFILKEDYPARGEVESIEIETKE